MDREDASRLPSPAVKQISKQKPKLTATIITPIWIVLSSSVIIYNNYLYNTLNFCYLVFTIAQYLTLLWVVGAYCL